MSTPTVKQDHPPIPAANPYMSYGPMKFDVPGRQIAMEVKVSAPAVGDNLPVLLLSHGHGGSNFLSSIRGYGPLVDFYASHGFVVIQMTHQDSKTVALDPKGPEGPLFWRSRAEDVRFVIDHLDKIEATVPLLLGRLDRQKLVAVGHSLGGHTVNMLAGARVTNVHTGDVVQLHDPRIKAVVTIGAPGDGKDLAEWASTNYPELKGMDFSTMTTPALVVVGDNDYASYFSDRQDWRSDAFRLSPGPKTLLTLVGAEHLFGGISGYDAKETSDEDPDRVALVQRLTWAYLRSALYPEDRAWDVVVKDMDTATSHVRSK